MTPEESDDVRALWRTQKPEGRQPDLEEMRRLAEQMERKVRRIRINVVAALVLASVGIVSIAVVLRHPLVTIGAFVSVAGLAFMAFEVFRHWKRAPVAENGGAASIDYHRALLQHQIEFHRRRLWLRVLILAPGGVLFFLGLAAARPDLAPLIYLELATFIVGVMLIVPLNRKRAAKLENQLAKLQNIGPQGSSSIEVS